MSSLPIFLRKAEYCLSVLVCVCAAFVFLEVWNNEVTVEENWLTAVKRFDFVFCCHLEQAGKV